MKIIEYRLHGNPAGQGMITPGFVKHGGFYQNPENQTYIGVIPEPCGWYVPDTVEELTLAELKTRVVAISKKFPMPAMRNTDEDAGVMMTKDQIEKEIDDWYADVTSRLVE